MGEGGRVRNTGRAWTRFQGSWAFTWSTLPNVLDEYSRVCLAIHAGRRCKSVDIIEVIRSCSCYI
jgi:hypothetical protein